MTISDLSRTFIDGTQKESEGKRSHTKNVRYVYIRLVEPAAFTCTLSVSVLDIVVFWSLGSHTIKLLLSMGDI